jgi:hypothetical protein
MMYEFLLKLTIDSCSGLAISPTVSPHSIWIGFSIVNEKGGGLAKRAALSAG